MQELLWLLLPVAAASGWLMASGDGRRRLPTRNAVSGALSPDYFKGLNYLLNEQPDKATDVFIKMLDVDCETVETHLAVGNLFRRRGEVDRAIRIHQNLVERESLSVEQRTEAMLELGRDYMRAGLFDRAEQLLMELLRLEAHVEPALCILRDIYQQEKEWEKALEVVRHLQSHTGRELNGVMAQYYCELAEDARSRRDAAKAKTWLGKASDTDRNCVRASIIEAQMCAEQGRYADAVAAYQRVRQQDPQFMSEVADAMLDCYYRLGAPQEMAGFLKTLLKEHYDPRLVNMASDLIREEHGEHDAAIFVAQYLRSRPSLAGLARLVDLSMTGTTGELRDTFRVIKHAVDSLSERRPLYKCGRCGFAGKTLHWLCPSCKHWSTVKPIVPGCAEA